MNEPLDPAREREAQRQQALVQALWRSGAEGPLALDGLQRGNPSAGLDAYRRNAAAVAVRALAAAYPTVAALVGADCFAAMAHAHWMSHPPERGDLGQWGRALPAFITSQPPLASEPYLADSAALDWAVHLATQAADVAPGIPTLETLAHSDLNQVRLRLTPGAALIESGWPIVDIWQAHRLEREAAADQFDRVRAAFAAGLGQSAFVHRDSMAVRVVALEAAEARFTDALLRGECLSAALDAAGDGFAFDVWLIRALRSGWLQAVELLGPDGLYRPPPPAVRTGS